MAKVAVIIGAGPAGLTAGLELLRRTEIVPAVLEASGEIGGISRTVRYKGNRMDIGGHRFFSKSDRVMQWWMELMPPELAAPSERGTESMVDANAMGRQTEPMEISYQGKRRVVTVPAHLHEESPLRGLGPLLGDADEEDTEPQADGPEDAVAETDAVAEPEDPDLVMLIRPRRSRIYYLRKFFDYPITLTATTLKNLGAVRMVRVGASYALSRVRQIKPEKSLEDFLINRFGRELYLTFFKSYTEKVWGTPCHEISAEWGAQRIKGLSLTTAVKHLVKKMFRAQQQTGDLAQKGTDTSLIERFMYPKFGPGQLWEHVAELVQQKGGAINMGWKVDRLNFADGGPLRVTSIEAVSQTGERRTFAGDYFFSTMPMRELLRAMNTPIPANVLEVSDGLQYRDFITVGLLVDRLKVSEPDGGLLTDTWISIQEPDVLLGRLQIFNNWSPYLVSDAAQKTGKVWIGLEYFCYDTDDLWKMADEDLKKFAIA